MRSQPLVSILIVTHNSADYIEACLQALRKISYQPIELIVVDNQSSDQTPRILKKELKKCVFKTRLVENKGNDGYAVANNQAAALAEGVYLFILNPDTTVSPHFLEPLVERAEHDTSIAACQPAVFLEEKPNVLNLTGKVTHYLGFDWLRDFEKKKLPPTGEIVSFSGSGVLVRKSVFNSLGGFDERYFMYYEDSDLGWRMRLHNHRIWFEPTSILYHDYKYIPAESYNPYKRKLYLYERNRLLTICKNYTAKTLLLLSPAILIVEVGMTLYALFGGWIVEKLKGYTDLIFMRSYIINKRQHLALSRKITDREIVRDFVSEITFKEFRHPAVIYVFNPLLYLYWRLIKPLI